MYNEFSACVPKGEDVIRSWGNCAVRTFITCNAPKCCKSYCMKEDGMDWPSNVWLL